MNQAVFVTKTGKQEADTDQKLLRAKLQSLSKQCEKISDEINKDLYKCDEEQDKTKFMLKQQKLVCSTIEDYCAMRPHLLDIVVLNKLYEVKEHNQEIEETRAKDRETIKRIWILLHFNLKDL